MSTDKEKHGVWFVYDGECPICCYAAEALKIKQDYGTLHTLNALEHDNDPLILEINRLGLDLDEGMVIYANKKFYHGKQALKFMARYGEVKNPSMAVFKGFFWSDFLLKLVYPWLRGARNLLLRQKNVSRIDNLQLKNDPTFKSVFGENWDALPPVMKKRYSPRPYTQDVTQVQGVLDIMCKPPLLWLRSLMTLLGQVPAYNESNVPVSVRFQSNLDTKSFSFNRTFRFANGNVYQFLSHMFPIENNELVEIMRFGLGWRTAYAWDGEKVVLSHRGYALRLFGHLIPLPLTMLIGAGSAEERPIDDNNFDMEVRITHPWWGKIYEYKGRFELCD